MSELKQKQIFSEKALEKGQQSDSPELTAQKTFSEKETFVPVKIEEDRIETEQELQLEHVIRPRPGRKWLATGVFATFAGLVGWQAVDSFVTAVQTADWLALGWAGFITAVASLGLGAIGKELWKLRKLRNHFNIQEEAELLVHSDSVGKGKVFCEKVAEQSGVLAENPGFDRWQNSINPAHSDAEILDMYDSMVVSQQDKLATKVVSQHATESAALVAVSPLAAADMLLVAWRNFKMIDNLSKVYGVELGYASRIKLLRAVFVNMAAAGASELAIDAGMDLMSMDLAGKVSARAGQGLGVGILTARLGLKAMALLRPLPWYPDRQVKLGTIRKAVVAKVASITMKP
ncbi:TPA: TIGR01620 family protein [Vibrio parahaemolyticus]|uniref:YcjF family protein n=1 Tax=Vibrio parahaemolyticus TaxID=670 RepID=UPI00112322C8|nr:TIGR01620 family protein [Vibrio parahaemolyticus]TOI32757.1 TIGR01620 family protein [Vibrio parahaemolyticus]HCG8547437.1 TIGR01620 family protein [Vibrio parahaemolyticus]HCH0769892.1 TIGR01620 family protein [Vibrio parahaemolyticus]HCH1004678.1 TIGR01620 family protein [Vibrio parahaemolyticus]HCM1288706.1 TIGR01620 family protein [Vibrio parahaemolyticus]